MSLGHIYFSPGCFYNRISHSSVTFSLHIFYNIFVSFQGYIAWAATVKEYESIDTLTRDLEEDPDYADYSNSAPVEQVYNDSDLTSIKGLQADEPAHEHAQEHAHEPEHEPEPVTEPARGDTYNHRLNGDSVSNVVLPDYGTSKSNHPNNITVHENGGTTIRISDDTESNLSYTSTAVLMKYP